MHRGNFQNWWKKGAGAIDGARLRHVMGEAGDRVNLIVVGRDMVKPLYGTSE